MLQFSALLFSTNLWENVSTIRKEINKTLLDIQGYQVTQKITVNQKPQILFWSQQSLTGESYSWVPSLPETQQRSAAGYITGYADCSVHFPHFK